MGRICVYAALGIVHNTKYVKKPSEQDDMYGLLFVRSPMKKTTRMPIMTL